VQTVVVTSEKCQSLPFLNRSNHAYSMTSSASAIRVGGTIHTERPCCFKIDGQIELGRLRDWQLGRFSLIELIACASYSGISC
jgi:hypothetical protein